MPILHEIPKFELVYIKSNSPWNATLAKLSNSLQASTWKHYLKQLLQIQLIEQLNKWKENMHGLISQFQRESI